MSKAALWAISFPTHGIANNKFVIAEAKYSPLTRSEIKKKWNYNFTSPYVIMAW
jgi:hypothetical protein